MKKLFLFIFLITLFCNHAFAQTDPIDSSRLIFGGSWKPVVGVEGGIPTGQTIYKTEPTSVSLTTLNNDIAACQSNQVVLLTNGTFNLNGTIVMQTSGVVLRGSVDAYGNPTTYLTNCNIQIGDTGWYMNGNNAGHTWTDVSVSSGISRGSSNIVLSSSISGLAQGSLLFLAASSSSIISGGSYSTFLSTYPFLQIVKCSSVSGTSVTFWPPIQPDYLTTLHAVMGPVQATSRVGVENLYMWTSGGYGDRYIGFNMTDQCWVKNCHTREIGAAGRHIYLELSFRPEVRHTEINHVTFYGANNYAIDMPDTSFAWIEDNYFHDLSVISPMYEVTGAAWTYNYGTNFPYNGFNSAKLSPLLFFHGQHSCYCLFEGNVYPKMDNEGWQDSSGQPQSTRNIIFFRQRQDAWESQVTDPTGGGCLTTHPTNTYMSAVGCVLGTTGHVPDYFYVNGNNIFCWAVDTEPTFQRYWNWNSADNGIHSDEGPTNGYTVANSYIYASKPAFFGNLLWPPISPTNVAYSKSVTNLPAGYRAVFGFDPPQGTDTNAPYLSITAPNPLPWTTNVAIVPTSGVATDDVAVAFGYWTNNTASQNGSLSFSDATHWSASVPILAGDNSISIVVYDTSDNTTITNFTLTDTAPYVTSISPSTGPVCGGTSVSVGGANFTSVTGVYFGTTSAVSYIVNSSSSITATSPFGYQQYENITIVTSSGTSPTSSSTLFTFTSCPNSLHYSIIKK